MTGPGSARVIRAGFIPLIDAAILIVANARGFAADENIDLQLVREMSWANIRDKTAVGHFDVAHMLAPMPIAANLGLDPIGVPMIAPMALGLNGNTITISNSMWDKLLKIGTFIPGDPASFAHAMAQYLKGDTTGKLANRNRPVFAVVHPVSAHRYELAYLLAYAGITLGEDIELVVLPPTLMADALASGRIAGFCAGEPWGSLAQLRGHGQIAATKAAVWRSSPEKVLGVRAEWADQNNDLLIAFIRSLYRAAAWCGNPDNRHELAVLIAREEFLDQKPDLLFSALGGDTSEPSGLNEFIFSSRAATFPWISHALWFYSQMVRWGQARHATENAKIAAGTFRPDLYRAALAETSEPIPAASSKVEGALASPAAFGATRGHVQLGPDGFFDGKVFDPDDIEGYLRSFG